MSVSFAPVDFSPRCPSHRTNRQYTLVSVAPVARRRRRNRPSDQAQASPGRAKSRSNTLACATRLTVVGHHGGFATHVRAHWAWAIPLPEGLSSADAGPLLCGGVTVFAPLLAHAKPTDRVGVVGIGGLGRLAIKFASAYGCEVTALTSSIDKFEEARRFGAHHVVSSADTAMLKKLAGSFELVISTVNAPLDWDAMLGSIAKRARPVTGSCSTPTSRSRAPVSNRYLRTIR